MKRPMTSSQRQGIGPGALAGGFGDEGTKNVRCTRSKLFRVGFSDELDAVRLRPQRDVVRDIMLSAAECGAWLTLEELRVMTRFGVESIAAEVRALRTADGGGFVVGKRRRAAKAATGGADMTQGGRRRMAGPWEYRVEYCVGQRIECVVERGGVCGEFVGWK